MTAPRVIVAYGTRPESVKLWPVQDALKAAGFDVVSWCSGQSRDLAGSTTSIVWDDGLIAGVAECMRVFAQAIEQFQPQAVVVQGDTATAFAVAQASFLASVPVAHVEAGMRTYAREPFPEEAFRRQIAAVARWHFAPSAHEAENLRREMDSPFVEDEGDGVFVVGNTVIDTLPREPFRVLCTLHRRENWGERIRSALSQLNTFAVDRAAIVTAVIHPNWKSAAHVDLDDYPDLRFVPALDRVALLAEMRRSALVVTDSGGLQEEAAHFGVATLVFRTATERTALLQAGAVALIAPDDPNALSQALDREWRKRNCYGEGDASAKIAEILANDLLVR